MKKFTQRLLSLLMLLLAWGGHVFAQKSIPYSYGFEDNSLAVDGWELIGSTSSSTSISASAKREGSYGFAIHYSEKSAYLVSPELAGTDEGVNVTFYYKQYSSSYPEKFQVGYTTDATSDPSSFTYGAEITTSYGDWFFYENSFPAGTKKIAIKYIYSNAYYLYLDDFTFAAPPACPKPAGLNIEASGVNATLSWTSDASDFSIVHATEVSANPESLSAQSSTDNSLLFEDLALGDHYFWVKANCDADGASEWAGPATIHVGYCQPAPTSVDGNGITAVSFGSGDNVVNNSGTKLPASAPFYGDYSAQIGAVAASLTATVDITFSTGYTYGTIIWVDWNKSLSFEDNEIVYAGESSSGNPTTLNATFDIPASQASGDYRMRIAAADSYYDSHKTLATAAGAEPCPTGTYTVVHDYTLRVLEAPSCMPVSGLSASNIQAHSAELNWTAGQSESAWKLYYKKAAEEDWGAAIDVDNLPYTLEGLDAATTYQFKVVAVCSDSDESDASAVASFMTECETLTIDADHSYQMNFDALTAGNNVLPICWNAINTTTNGSYQGYPKVYANSYYSTYAQSAPNCLYLYSYAYYNYSGTTYDPQPQYAILPEMDGLDGKEIILSAKGYNATSTLKVGVMADPTDPNSFEPIQELELTTSYQEFTIDLSGHGGNYVALMIDAASSERSTNGVYVDDIIVREIPSCLKPTDLVIANITTNSAELNWAANSGEGAWKLYYKKASDEEFGAAVDVDADALPYTLEGLDAATTYQFKVVAVCDEENESEESAVAGFVTECEAISSFPWSETFNSLTAGVPVCWDNAEGTTTNESYKWNYYASGRDGAGLRFNSYNNGSDNTNFLKTPILSLPSDKEMQLSFMYKNPAGGDFSVLISTDGGVTYEETPLASGLTSQSSWIEKECNLSAFVGQDVVIVFKGTSNYGNGDAYIYLDDIMVAQLPTCLKPSALSYDYSSRKAHSVQLAWTNGEEGQNAWEIAFSKLSNFNPDEQVSDSIVAANSNPFVLLGLEQSTTYYAYVRANCGQEDGKSLWSSSYVSFTTISGHQTLSSPAVVEGSLGSSSVKINWLPKAANELHQSYEVYYSKLSTKPDELFADSLILNVEDTSYVFSNLEPETKYYVWVRDNCGVDGLSDWSYSTNFTTTANCPIPAGISASEITARTADIAWSTGEADSYSVQYRVAEGMDGIIEEGFEGVSLPSDWTTEGNGTWSVGTGDYSSSTGAHSGSKNAKINHGTTGDETYLVTPSMNLEGKDGCRINLWYVNRAWVSDKDGFGIYYRISGGEWVEIFSTAVAHSDWTQFEGEVPVGALEANCQFGFKFTDGYGYGVSIDDIQIGTITPAGEWQEVAAESGERLAHLSGLEPETKYEVQVKASCGEEYSESIFFTTTPSCLPISALTLANVDAHAASFTWTASALAETQWQYACVEAGATPESWSLVSVTAADVSGLSSNTSYDFYVRAYCGSEDQSEAIMLNFRTDCETFIIDADHSFSEGFEEVTFVPNCWSSVASGSHNWSRTTSNVHSGSGSAHSGYYGDIYLILPDLQIEEDAYLSFWSYNNFVSDYTEAKGARNSVVLLAGEGEVELWAAESVSQSQVRTIINLSAYKGQTVSLAFKYEGDNAHDWYIDDVLVSAIPSLEISAAGYATYFNADDAFVMPNGVVGHVFSVADGLQQAYESGDIVPANVPLVLQGVQGEYSLIPTVGGESTSLANDLIGVNNEMTIVNHADTLYYVLSLNAANEVDSVGFYWMNETGAGDFTMPAHKAYLTVYNGAGAEAAPRFYLFHGENNATWLNNLQGVDGAVKFFHNGHFYIMRDHVIYDATGKRVELKYN